MSGLADLRDIFFVEAEELLLSLEEGLRALQSGAASPDTVNAVFRAVHSIKGGAGAFGLANLVTFAHRFETLLDDLRAARRKADADLIAALLSASDTLSDMVAAERAGRPGDPAAMDRALAALDAVAGGAALVEDVITFEPLPLAALAFDRPAETVFHISFRPDPDCFAAGHDPALLLRDLCALGRAEVTLDATALPDAPAFDPTLCALGWDITLQTDRTEADLRAVFDFIETACDLTITATPAQTAPVFDLPPLDLSTFGLPPVDPPPLDPPSADPPAFDQPARPPGHTGPASAAPPPGRPATAPRPTIRVEIERVDRLVDVLGELVIHQAMLTEAIGNSSGYGSVEVDRSLDQLRQLSRQIQDSVMAIRAQPVKPLFDRMHRILREAASAAGKQARLVTEGEATEVDRTIIERLADPLTHMIRNAVDHGLEKTDRRRSAGKPDEGTVTLSAAHRSGRIVITLADDGGGIDRDKVRQVAIDRGLIPASAELSPAEVDALLFLPGFSTASEVSALSGRGVGMDVVRAEITALGGRVSIASARGEGTVLTVSLPLTLAVLDGMVVQVAGQTLVLPVATIIETLRPDPALRHLLGQADAVLEVRGRCLPLVDVGTALGFRTAPRGDEGSIVVVVERGDADSLALMVDAIRDQRQVVIKGLEANYGQIPGIAAATVLGDGSVALILDPADLASVRIQPQLAAE